MNLFPSGLSDEPLLRVKASGLGGSGYAIPTWPDENGKPTVVPGVTTALGAIDKPALRQWAVDLTAAYAVANIDSLLNRTEGEGMNFLRWFHRRKPDLTDPMRTYHQGVLDDAAEMGTNIHKYVESDLAGLDLPTIDSREMDEMVGVWQDFKWEHDIRPIMIEATVVNREAGYAGTLDLLCELDGVPTVVDFKSSRNTYDEHWAQQAALGASYGLMVLADRDSGEPFTRIRDGKKVTDYWREEIVPAFSAYRLLHIRPSDYDKDGNPTDPFCELLSPDEYGIDMNDAYDLFLGALAVRKAQRKIKSGKKLDTDSIDE